MNSGNFTPHKPTDESSKTYTPVEATCPLDGQRLMRVNGGAARYFTCQYCDATYSSTKPEELDKRAKDYAGQLRAKRILLRSELETIDRIVEAAEKNGY